MPIASAITVTTWNACENGHGKITATVNSGRTEDLWVVFTNTDNGTPYTSAQISGVSSYVFEQENLPNGYYEVQAYGSISGPAPIVKYEAIDCVSPNTGNKVYRNLEEYYTDTGQPTGNVKPNTPGDPDYIAPEEDLTMCPI